MKQLKILVCAFACLRDPDTRFGFGKGGESELGWNMILQISKFGEVFVLTDFGNKQEIDNRLKEEKIFGVNFYYVSLPRFLNFTKKWIQIYAYLWQIKAYFVSKKLHKENDFDVFHHITYANDWMASFIGALLPVPYIRGPGGGAHRVPKEFAKEYPVKERLAQKIRSIGQWIFRHDLFFIIGQNKAKVILVCNKEAFNALPKKWKEKAQLFPVNGVSLKDLSLLGTKTENENNNFLILTAGKLIKIKGFDLAIKSFKIFSDKISDAKLIIVGDGPELQNLKKLSRELKLEDKIIFENWVPREKLFEKMLSCNVFLFASLRDGGGEVVVEAMAMGKPVVCFDIAGPGFHIDENCGIKIKSANPKQAVYDMAKALERLYIDKELRGRLGRGARQKAEENYNWDKLGARIEDIYQRIFQNGK
jgi:glycosyltransferase involved in cell wall biosynthesis